MKYTVGTKVIHKQLGIVGEIMDLNPLYHGICMIQWDTGYIDSYDEDFLDEMCLLENNIMEQENDQMSNSELNELAKDFSTMPPGAMKIVLKPLIKTMFLDAWEREDFAMLDRIFAVYQKYKDGCIKLAEIEEKKKSD